jgi:hypothetical protein
MNTKYKINLIRELWKDLANDDNVTVNIKKRKGKEINIGFINQYELHDFIPNKWFDWKRRVNAKIMVIGQDWGPYKALLPYLTIYNREKDKPNFNYDDYLFKTFSSRTEKFIINTIESTYREHYHKKITNNIWNKFIFTIAVMFTRQGNHFRGNEFYDEKFGMKVSLPYLNKQIDIVQPKIIIPLGGTAWTMIREIISLKKYPVKISDTISYLNNQVIKSNNIFIIPDFHPASHTNPQIQYNIWKTIWNYF